MSIGESIKSHQRILIFIFVAALLLRAISLIGVSIVFKGSNLNDDFEYGVIARSLIEGKGYSVPIIEISGWGEPRKDTGKYRPTADQLPFYPLVLALVYSLFSSPLCFWIVKFIQVIFSAATCGVIYLIALQLFNKKAATVAGFISSIYPVFILNNARMYPETFFTFWLALSVLYLTILKDGTSLKNLLIAGVLIGITLLNSNVAAPMLPFIGIYLLLLAGTWSEKIKRALLVMTAAFVIVSPWLVRNYFAFNEFPMMKSTAGLNFWLGNNPKATGTFFLPGGESIYSILPKEFFEGFKLSETEQDRLLYNDALSYVKRNPSHFAMLFLKRAYYFTWFAPDNLVSKEGRLYKKLFKLPYGFILICAIIGVFLSWKERLPDIYLLCSIILSVVFLYSVFIVGHLRYRMPIEPYLIILASYTISFLVEKYRPAAR